MRTFWLSIRRLQENIYRFSKKRRRRFTAGSQPVGRNVRNKCSHKSECGEARREGREASPNGVPDEYLYDSIR